MANSVAAGRSLEITPTWSVALVTTVMVMACFLVERSIFRLGKWLKKTKRKALLASLEKIKEELMLLGLISLMLGQFARWISNICVDSKFFDNRFFPCLEEDQMDIPPREINNPSSSHHCSEGREPFVSYEGLEKLHRFLFVLGITHVLYSCVTVGLAMVKIYSWRKWENHARLMPEGNLEETRNKVMRRQTTFIFHHTSHPWSRSRVLIWMLCFLRQFKCSVEKSDYMALRLGFITNHNLPLSYDFHNYMVRSMEDDFHGMVGISWPLWGYAIVCIFVNIHGINIYFWLSSIPAILVMLVGTKLQHVVSLLALEISESTGPAVVAQVKPHDDLFWFGKPDILLWLIQFISFQNASEMASFIWSLWSFKQRSCFMKNHVMIFIRLASGLLIQVWCSSCTVPLNVIVTQMGSKFKKALIAENIRESLHSWCKRVKERSKHSHPEERSACSLDSTVKGGDEIITVGSGTLSHCTSTASLDQETTECTEKQEIVEIFDNPQFDNSLRISAYSSESISKRSFRIPTDSPEQNAANEDCEMGSKFKKALIAENIRESLHSWCKRVKERSKHSHPEERSACSLDSTVRGGDEIITVGSGTLSHCTSSASLNQETT